MTFDDVINAVLPWIIGLGLVGAFIYVIRKPLALLLDGIKWVIEIIKGKGEEGIEIGSSTLQYE